MVVCQEVGKVAWQSHLFKNFPVCCDPHSQRLQAAAKQFQKFVAKLLPGRSQQVGVIPVSCSRGVGERKEGAPVLIKSCFFVCYGPVGLMNASPSGYQSQVIQSSVHFGSCCKSWGTRCMYKLFAGRYQQLGVVWRKKVDRCLLVYPMSREGCRRPLDSVLN